MKSILFIILGLLCIFITSIDGQECVNCMDCFTQSSCQASIAKNGNHCKWNVEVCEEEEEEEEVYQIIPISQTTSYSSDECICNQEYFSSTINTETSCICYDGMKSIKVQYTGSKILPLLEFYHDSNTKYEQCIFMNVKPNQIMECISFPYSQFVPDVIVKVTDTIYTENNCESSIDTSCSADIMDTICIGCPTLKIVGWIDAAHYLCTPTTTTTTPPTTTTLKGITQQYTHNREQSSSRGSKKRSSSSSDGGRRRRLNRRDSSQSSKKWKSKSKSSSSSGGSSGSHPWKKYSNKKTAAPETPIVPISTKYEVNKDIVTPSILLKKAYCECVSADSWDDWHYFDENGDIQTYSENNKEPKANGPNRGEINREAMDGVNMINITNHGIRCKCNNYIQIIYVLFFVYLCFIFI